MKTYKTLLVEDDPDHARLLAGYAGQVPGMIVVGVLNQALSALSFLQNNPVDLLVLDINLPQLSGLNLIRSLPQPPVVILTTSSLTDSLEAYELGVVDYLVKPFRFERFLRAVNRALPRLTTDPVGLPPASIFLKDGRASVQVMLDDISHAEAYGGFCRVFLPGRMLLVTHGIAELTERLPAARFRRVHRSYIVALDKIVRYTSREVFLPEQRIPVGEAYRESLLAWLTSSANGPD
jgi:DNA-binding LytR/AlgR family response regulator